VGDALGIVHQNVKQTVQQTIHQAFHDGEEWVKREPYPTPLDPVRWLVDINHTTYWCQERYWKRLAEKTSTEQKTASGDEHACSPSGATRQTSEVTESWPELCHWLAKHGLVVFVNAIGNDRSWQWAWLESSGAGYPDATAAITAAIQHRLTASDLWYSEYLMPEESE
jgi:hypothetical protein